MKFTAFLPLMFILAGCPYVGENYYDDNVRDADGDGFIGERFGGPDCRDDDPSVSVCDGDGDGVRSVMAGGDDCNDEDATILPGGGERCNEVDDDCDGLLDDDDPDAGEAVRPVWFKDLDGDGFGDQTQTVEACAAPLGWVANLDDCDDSRADVSPIATEFCDALDRNCDGDAVLNAADQLTWYTDDDGDGHGVPDSSTKSCVAVSGYAATDDDCDDAAASVHPGAGEVPYDGLDGDCSGPVGDDWDHDGDGYVPSVLPEGSVPYGGALPLGDCDDDNLAVKPSQEEICNGGVDDNCNGVADNDDATVGAVDRWTYYADLDGDGAGSGDAVLFCAGTAPAGFVQVAGDCDDQLSNVGPGFVEVCDGRDNNCNGTVDDGATDRVPAYADGDGDGYGGASLLVCAVGPGYASVGGDCNDADAQSYPGAPELCGDAYRQDCNDDLSPDDCDGDGSPTLAGTSPDCDDTDPEVRIGAVEYCDGYDNDCDELIDAADPGVNTNELPDWYRDADKDGHGDPLLVLALSTCTQPPGGVVKGDDCDDNDPKARPGLTESCDGVDNDCDGDVDNGTVLSPPTFYFDFDLDGYGDPEVRSVQGCAAPGDQWLLDGFDCDDRDTEQNPGADEVCDGDDNDCDELIDDGDGGVLAPPWYVDVDADGFGLGTVVKRQCAQPSGYSPTAGDCDDTNPFVAANVEWYPDGDFDGFGDADAAPIPQCGQPVGTVANKADCDDGTAQVSPSQPEFCDGIDNDCDAQVDDDDSVVTNRPAWYPDADLDGYGAPALRYEACQPAVGDVARAGDCDDTSADVHEFGQEFCGNDRDDDCDGLKDEPTDGKGLWFRDGDLDGFGSNTVTSTACVQPDGFVAVSGDCDDTNASVSDQLVWFPDFDADGFGSDELDDGVTSCTAPVGYVANSLDCDDTRLKVNPGQPELCGDGLDNNCVSGPDDDAAADARTWYRDEDDDDFGTPLITLKACAAPSGYVADFRDCNDKSGLISPVAGELCGDAIDNDCDGALDGQDPSAQTTTWYRDEDGDGHGNAVWAVKACEAPAVVGWVTLGDDCDDDDSEVGTSRLYFADADNDGFGNPSVFVSAICGAAPIGAVANSLDCDDTPGVGALRVPGSEEVCDEVDNDCDLKVDDQDFGIVDVGEVILRDTDLDGFGDGFRRIGCTPKVGESLRGGDCDDDEPSAYPGAPLEICDDNLDNDCDGISEAFDTNVNRYWSFDLDGDNFGTPGDMIFSCPVPVPAGGRKKDLQLVDCDDSNPAISQLTLWPDVDGDGFGATSGNKQGVVGVCTIPPGWTVNNVDCNDNPALHGISAYPGAAEVCDGIDNDCDGKRDSEDGGQVDAGLVAFIDKDGDGYGGTFTVVCGLESGIVFEDGDCNDNPGIIGSQINPSREENCTNGFDDNCDGQIDAADLDDGDIWYPDEDVDFDGDPTRPVRTCAPLSGYRDLAGDCADNDPSRNSFVTGEVCNTLDDDCDGAVDEANNLANGQGVVTWPDGDGDGYGDKNAVASSKVCVPGPGTATQSGDCVDNNPAVNPGVLVEVCGDGIDNNCSGGQDDADPAPKQGGTTWYFDGDEDLFGTSTGAKTQCFEPFPAQDWVTVQGDCDDANGNVKPFGLEVCDQRDNDCNGQVDEGLNPNTWRRDIDLDGFGTVAGQITSCHPGPPPGYVTSIGQEDCDDFNPSIRPGVTEVCDGVDNNCANGIVDEARTTWSRDRDGDGFGNNTDPKLSLCTVEPQPLGYVSSSSDCDDTNAAFNALLTYFNDPDGDKFASNSAPAFNNVCVPSATQALAKGDCQPLNTNVNPGAPELCDLIDNDCDGFVDAADTNVLDAEFGFTDMDQDGYGVGTEVVSCSPVAAVAGDCNDGDGELYPGAKVLVSPFGTGKYDEAELDLALSAACTGMTIEVDPGSYAVSNTQSLSKKLNIVGTDSTDRPEIQFSEFASWTFNTGGEGSVVRNLDLYATSPTRAIPLLRLDSATNGTPAYYVDNVSFLNANNVAGFGIQGTAGLAIFNAKVIISDAWFDGNTSITGLSGLNIAGTLSDVVLSDSTFARSTGSPLVASDSKLLVKDTLFEDNPGERVFEASRMITLTVRDTDFFDNSKGILLEQILSTPSSYLLERVRIRNLGDFGHGIIITATNPVNVTINESEVSGVPFGNGVWITSLVGAPTVSLDQMTFVNLGSSGFGVLREAGTVSVTDSIFHGSMAAATSGLVAIDVASRLPGGPDPLLMRYGANLPSHLWDMHVRDVAARPLGSHGLDTAWYRMTLMEGGDGDNLPDGWELDYLGTLAFGDTEDPDFDGDNNLAEYNRTSPAFCSTHPGMNDTDGDLVMDKIDSEPCNPAVQ